MKHLVDKMTRQKLIEEYKLICQKNSKLNRAARDLVEAKIARLHKAGQISIQELRINNNQI